MEAKLITYGDGEYFKPLRALLLLCLVFWDGIYLIGWQAAFSALIDGLRLK